MNEEDFFSAQNKIVTSLHQKSKEFGAIRNSEESIIVRWQQFIGIILPIQIRVIQEFDYSGDQSGLSQFNEQLMKLSEISLKLRKQNEEKWRFLLEHAFGVTGYKEISLQEARELIKEIEGAMTSKEFLEEVEQHFDQVDVFTSAPEKRQKLLEILLPLHMSIMSKHGFNGESGYIQAQRAGV